MLLLLAGLVLLALRGHLGVHLGHVDVLRLRDDLLERLPRQRAGLLEQDHLLAEHHQRRDGADLERARQLLEYGLAGRLTHFTVHPERLAACADEVVATIKAAYPDLDVPFHARWRHFMAGGFDRWEALRETAAFESDAAMARAAFDLAIVSVLLDAGAGAAWRYEEGRTGEIYTRSEGLAVASFDMFIGGSFSNRPEDPFRVDGEALATLSAGELAAGFQASADNPLLGLEARAALYDRRQRRLARIAAAHLERQAGSARNLGSLPVTFRL